MKKTVISLLTVLCMIMPLLPDTVSAYDDFAGMSDEEYAEWKESTATAADLMASGYKYIRNDYIEGCINGSGHYTLGTTGGTDLATDDNKKLLYGHPGSDTTETLIVVDGEEQYFNSSNTVVNDNQAISVSSFNGVGISQIITLENNVYTGHQDVASIKYTLTNNTSSAKLIGGRIMLDTMLGNNDGAPFRIPNIGDVTTEKEFSGNDIPEYWQAFDSLTNPNVISTGNFYRTVAEKPDKVQFAAWPRIRGSSWNFQVQSDQAVTRDSAVAAYFNPRTVLPGQSRTIVTYYGISNFGGTDLDGDVSVRVTAPSALEDADGAGYLNNPFVVTAYIGNNRNEPIRNLKASISLPGEIEVEGSDPTTQNIGELGVGSETYTKWTLRAMPQSEAKTVQYTITVTGDNISPKTVDMTLELEAVQDLTRTISFDLNGGSGTQPSPQEVPVGARGTEPEEKPVRNGYIFTGWYANPECSGLSWFNFLNSGCLSRVTEDITLYAGWKERLVEQVDLYNFKNEEQNFNSTYKLPAEYFAALTKGLTKALTQKIRVQKNDNWGGSGYGMGVSESLFLSEDLNQGFFQNNAQTTRSLKTPVENARVEGLINFYQLSQMLKLPMDTTVANGAKTQSELLSELVERAGNIDTRNDFVGVNIAFIPGGSPAKSYTLMAHSLKDGSDGYEIKVFEANENTNTENSYILVSPDYSDAQFKCEWSDEYDGMSIAAGTMKIESLFGSDEYNPVNLQSRLLDRSEEAAPDEEYTYDRVEISYDDAAIDNRENNRCNISGGEYLDGSLRPAAIFPDEGGTSTTAVYDAGDYYKISPSDEYDGECGTSVLFGSSEFINVKTAERGIVTAEKGERITVLADNANEMTVALTTQPRWWDSLYIRHTAKEIIYNYKGYENGGKYAITCPDGLDGAWLGITVGDNSYEMQIHTDKDTVYIDPEGNVTDGDSVPDNPEVSPGPDASPDPGDHGGNNLGKLEARCNVDFYTYGGSTVESISDIEKGSKIQKPEDPVFEGFVFGGWYKSAKCLDGEEWDFDTDTVEGDTILHAKWLSDENYMHSITFKAEGFDDIIVLVRHGGSLSESEVPKVPHKQGYIGQWDITDFSNITSNMIVNAIYSEVQEQAEKPVAYPAGGTFYTTQNITLTTPTEGADIYYTTDGTDPTDRSSKYTGPIAVSQTTELRAVAIHPEMDYSEVMTETYTIAQLDPSKTSGTEGPVTWRYSDGVLTFSGQGTIPDYNPDTDPPDWFAFKNEVIKIVFEEGSDFNNIGKNTFLDFTRTEVVELTANVGTIGEGAFEGCTALKEIKIPENSSAGIGVHAFKDCKSLTEIVIPSKIRVIGEGAFEGCDSLVSIKLPFIGPQVGSVDKKNKFAYIFGGTVPESLRTIIITNETDVPADAFEGCGLVENIRLNDGVKTIGAGAFSNCAKLQSFVVPGGVTSIDKDTFRECSDIRSIEITDNITNIGASAFDGCSHLESIYVPGVERINDYTFRNCAALTELNIPTSVNYIGNGIIEGCKNLIDLKVPFVGANAKASEEPDTQIIAYFFGLTDNSQIPAMLTTVEITSLDGSSYIPENAFAGCANIEDIIVDGGRTIGTGAFKNCRSLKHLYIPERVTQIGEKILEGCNQIETLTVPFIGSNARDKNTATSVLGGFFGWDESGDDPMGTVQIYNEEGDSHNYMIPDSLKYVSVLSQVNIPMGAFGDCIFLEQVSLVSGRTLGKRAFFGCTALKSVSLPNDMEEIHEEAFAGCNKLETINIPQSVRKIEAGAFYGTDSLTNITIPGTVDYIDEGMFNALTGLYDVQNAKQSGTVITCCNPSAAYDFAQAHNIQTNVVDAASLDVRKTKTFPARLSNGSYLFSVTNPRKMEGTMYVELYNEGAELIQDEMKHTVQNGAEYRFAFDKEDMTSVSCARIYIKDDEGKIVSTDSELLSIDGGQIPELPEPVDGLYKFELRYNNGIVRAEGQGTMPSGAVLIQAEYKDGRMQKAVIYDAAELPKSVGTDFDADTVKFMLWKDTGNMEPLAKSFPYTVSANGGES